jgi:hypothetical protein
MLTPAINRFVQFGNVSELAAQAASATTSLGHCVLPNASLAMLTAIRRASFLLSSLAVFVATYRKRKGPPIQAALFSVKRLKGFS